MNKYTRRGHLAALLTVLIWGTTFIATKVLLESFQPVEILFFRFLLGYAALWIVFPHPLRRTTAQQEWIFAGAGLCGICLYYLLENIALTYTMASNVGRDRGSGAAFHGDAGGAISARRGAAAGEFLRGISRSDGRRLSHQL